MFQHDSTPVHRHRPRQARHGREAQGRRHHGRRHAEQAKIAEDAGAVAVMALERVPADIRRDGGVARMSDPDMIDGIIAAVSIPVMAKARIGHFVEAQVLQALGVDYIDESEVLTPADEAHHIDKCAVHRAVRLRRHRPRRGAAPHLRGRGDDPLQGRGRHRQRRRGHPPHAHDPRRHQARWARSTRPSCSSPPRSCGRRSSSWARSPRLGKLPVVLFTAGGIATPADAAMMMQLGADGVFVGSGIFKSGDPAQRAAAIVQATTFHDDPDVIAKVSRGLGEADGRHQRRRRCPSSERYATPRLVATAWRPRHRGPRPAGRRPRAPGRAARAGCRGGAGAAAGGAGRPRRARDPRRRVDDHRQAADRSACSSRCAPRVRGGLPAYGSCAGMILLADRILDAPPDQETVGGLDVTVRRNAFGRQVDSFETDIDFEGLDGGAVHAVFIRAPVGRGGRRGRRGPRPGRRRSGRR